MNTKTPPSHLPQTLGYAVLALLLGLVIGNSATKADLRHAREEIDKLKRDLANRNGNPASLSGITSMLNLPEKRQPTPGRRHSRPAPVMVASNTAALSRDNSTQTSSNGMTGIQPTGSNTASPSMRKQIETASNLWKTRSDLARNSFVSNVTTSDDQAVQFDVIMAAMNLRLSNSISQYAATIKQAKEVTPETGLRMLNELSGDLMFAYQDLDRTMPPTWRKQAGKKFAVFDFINPDVAIPLTDVQDAFHEGHQSQQGGSEDPDAVTVIFP